MSTISLSVSGMTCNHCVAAVRKAIDSVPGAHADDVAVPDGAGTDITTALVDAIEDAGYEARPATAGSDAPSAT